MDLVLLRRERERVDERSPVLDRLTQEPHPTHRVRVLDELVLVELEMVEPLPVLGLRLALVVVEEVRKEPARTPLLLSVEQRLVERDPRRIPLLGLLRLLALLRRHLPRKPVRPEPEQPLVERDRRAAVLLVVRADALEQRVLLRLEPLLEEDDRLGPAHDLGRALEPVQLLDLLDRVARDAGPQRLPDDAVEVDEQLLPQPVVDLALARRVLAHEAPDRRALVRRVVVDVQVGVDAAARLDPVDEALEGGLLAVAVEAPDDLVAELTAVRRGEACLARVPVTPPEQILEPARRLVERVALEVEPDVARRRRRKRAEAAVLLVREELDAPLARAREVELERGLRADALERLRPDAGDLRRGRRLAERRQRRDPCGGEPLRVQPPEPRDEDRVVLGDAPVLAEVAEVADRAVVDRPRPRLGSGCQRTPVLGARLLDRSEQPFPAPAEERDELGRPQRRALARAELDVDVLGQPTLDSLELLGVEAELDRVERLRGARELRVDGLVRRLVVGAGHARPTSCVHAHEEVGEPAPRAVREVGLVDDVSFRAPDGLLGRAASLVGVEVLVVVGLEAQDAEPVRLEPREMRSLVLVPLPHDDLPVRVDDVRPHKLAALNAQLELRQVRAG